MNTLLKLIVCAGVVASAGAAAPAFSAADPCAIDSPVMAGATVRDQEGMEIGWVSLMQCSTAGRANLLVRLKTGLGSAVKIVPLDAVAEKGSEVIVARDLETILKLPQLGEPRSDVTIAEGNHGPG